MTDANQTRSTPVQDRAGSEGPVLQRMATRHLELAAQERAAFAAALRVAFGRMAADVPGLDSVVQQVDFADLGLAEMLDLVEPGMFMAILEGQGEAMGLAVACPNVLAAVIEAQTTGRVDTAPVPPRAPTRTDAALIAPCLDTFLSLAGQLCADLPQAGLVTGYVYGSYLADPRPLGLMMDDRSYHVLHLRVSLGFGARIGDLRVFLPKSGAGPARAAQAPTAQEAARNWQEQLEYAVQASEVVVTAVLARLSISLSDALRLRPGDILKLPESALETLRIETISQDPICLGRLGQARGQRAVRLTSDPGVLTDPMGADAQQPPLAAKVIRFSPPQAAFVPDPPNPEVAIAAARASIGPNLRAPAPQSEEGRDMV